MSKEINSYILFLNLITSLVLGYYSVSLLISQSPFLLAFSLFSFHLCSPRACQMAGVDTCPISTFHKSPCSSCKTDNHYSNITFILMRLES